MEILETSETPKNAVLRLQNVRPTSSVGTRNVVSRRKALDCNMGTFRGEGFKATIFLLIDGSDGNQHLDVPGR